MNIIIITTGNRPELLRQTFDSLYENATDWEKLHVTVVEDGGYAGFGKWVPDVVIHNNKPQGASASRNIGAGSVPKHRRQDHVLFLDDDVYMTAGWDDRLNMLSTIFPDRICSGYSHPYNIAEAKGLPITTLEIHDYWFKYGEPLVISSVAMMMPWSIFDDVGPWDEPGGPGGSEDYALCMRAKDKAYGFAVTDPECILHTGIWSSNGNAIVGQSEVVANNQKLLDHYALNGRVVFG